MPTYSGLELGFQLQSTRALTADGMPQTRSHIASERLFWVLH
ncbi:MAG: hypothetical protein AAFQ89_07855 [Cyanobacteria bacterium J06626_18]